MDERRMKRASRFPSALGIATRLAYAYGKARGLPMTPLLERSGLTRRQIEDSSQRLAVADQIAFLDAVADAAGDDLLGLHIAKHCELRASGLFYYVLASSATMLEVCERGARFSAMVNEGAVQRFVDGQQFGIEVHYAGVSRYQDRQQVEFWFAVLMRLVRELTGGDVVAQRVRLRHSRTRGAREMSSYFGCVVEYGASVDEILFARKFASLPVVNADPFLNRLLVSLCEEAVAKRSSSPGSIRTQVENSIAALLPHGDARVNKVAKELGMSPRTLARHLTREGATFSGVLNDVRRHLANRYLEDESLSISQIAWLLGYQDIGAFSHAFKRWTGTTPREAAAKVR